MSKCIRCGKSFFSRGRIKLIDASICSVCFSELGFDPKNDRYIAPSEFNYYDIKVGRVAYYQNKEARHQKWLKDNPELASIFDEISSDSVNNDESPERFEFSIANHGQERDLICTEEERQIYNNIIDLLSGAGLDSSIVELSRKSDNYLSVIVESKSGYGLIDLARIKYTNRAKWIKVCPEFASVTIENPDDIFKYNEHIINAYRLNQLYF